MFDLSHDLHFRVDLLIKNAVLHESSLLKFLCSIRNTVKLVSDLVHNSKCTLANTANFVIFRAASPFPDMSTH